jgi:hypothetical protein
MTRSRLVGRLVKLLGMVDSQYDGEALNAARSASRLVRDNGLSWNDILQPFAEQPDNGWKEPTNIAEAVDICLAVGAPLSDWDLAFLATIRFKTEISPKQRQQLQRIISICRAVATHSMK